MGWTTVFKRIPFEASNDNLEKSSFKILVAGPIIQIDFETEDLLFQNDPILATGFWIFTRFTFEESNHNLEKFQKNLRRIGSIDRKTMEKLNETIDLFHKTIHSDGVDNGFQK